MLISLRPFSPEDWPVISKYQYPGISETEAKALIAQWLTRCHEGRYFEILAIDSGCEIVGYVSLFEQENGRVSEGVEVYPPFRRQGFAHGAVTLLLAHANALGYQTVTAQVRQDNAASLALHRKLGFTTADSFVNKRGHPLYSLSLDISQEIATSLRSSQ